MTTHRTRLAAVCVLLVGLAFVQAPGFLVADTKFDLAVSPVRFLGRALHLWDGQGTFGQLQNQAYGYLWPMGPFFAVGDLLAVPGWAVQRTWLAVVLVVAFLGAARVARALGIRSDVACIAGGLAFALSPRMLTTLGPISIEAWPSALAPWVLLPLITGSTTGSARRAAAWSALAVAMVGGVNAAATLAVVPMGVVWLLTRSPGRRRRTLLLWWPAFTALGTLWWLVPLLLLGAYSPPFLDYIETTAVTTFPTDLFDVLRGTSNWVPYVDASSRAGNDLITTPFLVVDSAVLLVAGFAGLLLPRAPQRRFLALSLLVGVLMVAAGHSGPVQGWFAGDIRSLLDGALAPLRNVHKFDPIVRLPLALGLAIALDHAVARRAERPAGAGRANRLVLAATVLVALAGSVAPALADRITPARPVLNVPGYWQETATWLSEQGDGDQAMLIPGTTFADYLWGAPRDEPLQFLAHSRWAVRNVIPLTPTGTIRMLDAVEQRLAQGSGSPGLVAYLRRAGIRYLVVRNDATRGSDVPDPVLVHQAVAQSPGLTRVASFGPETGGGPTLESDGRRIVVNGGWQSRYPAVEIFRVPGEAAAALAAGNPTTVVGGPEDLADLEDLGVLGDEPTVLAADATGAPAGPVVLTDGLRARERDFARIHDGSSAVLTPGDVRRTTNRARDYQIDDGGRWSTQTRLDGARAIRASSSRSDADAAGGSMPGNLPYAAVDGRAGTEWISGGGQAHPWWQLDLSTPTPLTTVTVTGGPSAARAQTVRVRTQQGVSEAVRVGPRERQPIPVPAGTTTWVRIEEASGAPRAMALGDVQVAGVRVVRRLAVPALPSGWPQPAAVVLRSEGDPRRGCAEVDGDVRCVPGRSRTGEEPFDLRRVVTLPTATSWRPRLVVRPGRGRGLDRLVLAGGLFDVTASSRAATDPRSSPLSAVDGDTSTSWVSDPRDLRPTLALRWLGPRTLDSLRLTFDTATAAQRPTALTLTWPGGTRKVALDASGRASFRPIRTANLRIRIDAGDDAVSLGFDSSATSLGYGITELSLGSDDLLPIHLSEVSAAQPCGSGPTIVANGVHYRTRIVASPARLARGELVPAEPCTAAEGGADSIPLLAGENTVDVLAAPAAVAESLVLAPVGQATTPAAPATPLQVTGGAAERRIAPGPGARVAVLRQNANAGWHAVQGGRTLVPVTIDGWQQGFVLRGNGPVSATFAPDRRYRLGLGVGLVAALALVVVALLRHSGPRRADPALVEREVGWPVAAALAALAGGLLAGWPGVAVTAVVTGAVLVLRRTGRHSGAWPTWVAVLPCLVAGALFALRPWADPSGWAGDSRWLPYLLLVPLVAVVVSASSDRRSLGGLLLRARAGRSTSR